MSRLDAFIRRLTAQRGCLNLAAELLTDLPGPVLEIGLGNGRTYDHLRTLFTGRDIFVFERKVAAHPSCTPDDDHLILGDIHDTVPNALDRIGGPAALAHADIGSGDKAADKATGAYLGGVLVPLMAPGGIIVSDQDMDLSGTEKLPLPDGIEPGRYFMYRIAGGSS